MFYTDTDSTHMGTSGASSHDVGLKTDEALLIPQNNEQTFVDWNIIVSRSQLTLVDVTYPLPLSE